MQTPRIISAIKANPRIAASTILKKFPQIAASYKSIIVTPSMDLSSAIALSDGDMTSRGTYEKPRDPRFIVPSHNWIFFCGQNDIDFAVLDDRANRKSVGLKIGFPATSGEFVIISFEDDEWSTTVITPAP